MSLTLSDIGRIANLARLELPPAQAERMLTQLNGFFDIVEQMNAVDTTGVEPLAHPTAVIDDGAEIGPGCRIGPYCVIGAQVTLGANVVPGNALLAVL